jgi:hypothetical protein
LFLKHFLDQCNNKRRGRGSDIRIVKYADRRGNHGILGVLKHILGQINITSANKNTGLIEVFGRATENGILNHCGYFIGPQTTGVRLRQLIQFSQPVPNVDNLSAYLGDEVLGYDQNE